MGMEVTDQKVKALLSEGDASSDAQIDFSEFVTLIQKFQSSREERAHQQADRKTLTGLADAVKNMNVKMVETEFGSKAVVERRRLHEWEYFIEYSDPLHWAAGKGDLAAVEQFVQQRHSAPYVSPEMINRDGKTPMHYAAVWNQVHILRWVCMCVCVYVCDLRDYNDFTQPATYSYT
jgi:hypothetical protein